jgi:hypothetical protein
MNDPTPLPWAKGTDGHSLVSPGGPCDEKDRLNFGGRPVCTGISDTDQDVILDAFRMAKDAVQALCSIHVFATGEIRKILGDETRPPGGPAGAS